MKTLTFNLIGRTVKEIHFDSNDLKHIKYAEKQKARLENAGYSLAKELVGFCSTTLIYKKVTA